MFKQSVIFSAFALLGLAPAAAADLSVRVAGIKPGKGPLFVSVQKREDFMSDRSSHARKIDAPAAGDQVVVFPNVAPGTYAVSVWQDSDGNGQFSTTPEGMPTDGWAMTNAERLRGEPKFDQVSTEIGSRAVALTLPMQYYATPAR